MKIFDVGRNTQTIDINYHMPLGWPSRHVGINMNYCGQRACPQRGSM